MAAMAPVHAPEREKHVDWILDRIFKVEYLALLTDSWAVWRQGDNANHFQVRSCLTYPQAKTLARELESRGHKHLVQPCGGVTVLEADRNVR